MSTAEQERETEVVVGLVGGVTRKRPDTWTVAVTPDGSQYSRNLWTKDVGLVQALEQGYLGQRLQFVCGVSHWTNQQNQPVRSLWINEVAEAPPAGAVQTIGQQGLPQQVIQQAQPQQQATVMQLPQPQQASQQQVVSAEAEREIKIMRQTAAKCAVWMLATLPPEERSFPHLVTCAEGWYAYFTQGPSAFPKASPVGQLPAEQGVISMAGQLPQPPQQQQQFADPDDIPF